MKKLISLWNIAMGIFKRKHKPTKTNRNLNYLYNQQINNKRIWHHHILILKTDN